MSESNKTTTINSGCKHTISTMYERWALDCVIEAAQGIASDFVSRPRQYSRVSEPTATILQNLWYLSGADPGHPDLTKRERIFEPLIGGSDGERADQAGQFHADAAALRDRANDFTNRVFSTGEENLRQAVSDAAVTFRSYLGTLVENSVVRLGNQQTRSIFDAAVVVLLDQTVCGVFGRTPASQINWPVGGTFDSAGAQVIEAVTTALQTGAGIVSQSQFIVIQRIGFLGAGTIDSVLDADLTATEDLEQLIQLTYSWKASRDALTL
ncbi:hypothetical protein [Nocardia sp. NPDC058497]|uniref:hypothetical protein n=1 Tax=Nocardia sp. NPDC058497 TaxID=3346529 RepID=UPI0036473BA5